MHHSSNKPAINSFGSDCYQRAQNAIGAPQVSTLQVDESIESLSEAVEFHIETVRALLRRLQPVTGDTPREFPICGEGIPVAARVPLSLRIDGRREILADLTAEVQGAIRALQI